MLCLGTEGKDSECVLLCAVLPTLSERRNDAKALVVFRSFKVYEVTLTPC